MESDKKLLTEIKNYESDHCPLTPLKLFWIVLHILERAEQVVIALWTRVQEQVEQTRELLQSGSLMLQRYTHDNLISF